MKIGSISLAAQLTVILALMNSVVFAAETINIVEGSKQVMFVGI